jgi:hypothetical protein
MVKISSKRGFIGLLCGWGLDGVDKVTVTSPIPWEWKLGSVSINFRQILGQ